MRPGTFGIMLPCYGGDVNFVKGCCASIRAHMPDVPICLVPDGHLRYADLKAAYGVTVLERDSVDPRLTDSYGYGLTKMISFWHSPFERFLHLDSDTVCWGDVLQGVPWRDYDLIFNEPHEVITADIQRAQYFDPDQLFQHIEHFDWKGRPYFNTGCFVAKRGIFDLQDYRRLLDLQRSHPGILLCGDQGILNVLTFSGIARDTLKARSWPLQAVVPVIPVERLRRRFRIESNRPMIDRLDKPIIHWAGPKPSVRGGCLFHAPMTHYRCEHRRRTTAMPRRFDVVALIAEDAFAWLIGRSRSRARILRARAGRGLSSLIDRIGRSLYAGRRAGIPR